MCFWPFRRTSDSVASVQAVTLCFGDKAESASINLDDPALLTQVKKTDKKTTQAFWAATIPLNDSNHISNLTTLFTLSTGTKLCIKKDGTLEKVEGVWNKIKYYWSRRHKRSREEQDAAIGRVVSSTLEALEEALALDYADQKLDPILKHFLHYLVTEKLAHLPPHLFKRSVIKESSLLERALTTELIKEKKKLAGLMLSYREAAVDIRPQILINIKRSCCDIAEKEGEFTQMLGKDFAFIGDGGSGGARRGFSREEETIFANKADDESVYGENNPRKRAKIKKWLYKGPEALRGHSDAQGAELAFLQDCYGGYNVVPPTKDYWATSETFVGPNYKRCSLQVWVDGARSFDDVIKKAGVKTQSVWFHSRKGLKKHYHDQMFSRYDLNDVIPNDGRILEHILPSSLFNWFGLADWEEENRDCHFENGLVKVYEVDKATVPYQLMQGGELSEEEVTKFVNTLFTKKEGQTQTNYQLLLQELFRGEEFSYTFKKENPSEDQKLLETLYPHLAVDWRAEAKDTFQVKKTLRTIFIKIDNDSSFPHAHESSYLGTRKKHLIEVLPPLHAPLSDDFIDAFNAMDCKDHLAFLDAMANKVLKNAIPNNSSFVEFMQDTENRALLDKWLKADPQDRVYITVSEPKTLIRKKRRNDDTYKEWNLNTNEEGRSVSKEAYYRHKLLENLVPILAKDYNNSYKALFGAHSTEFRNIHGMIRTRKESHEVLLGHMERVQGEESETEALGPIFQIKTRKDFEAKLEEVKDLDGVKEYNKAFSEHRFFETFHWNEKEGFNKSLKETYLSMLTQRHNSLSEEQIKRMRRSFGEKEFDQLVEKTKEDYETTIFALDRVLTDDLKKNENNSRKLTPEERVKYKLDLQETCEKLAWLNKCCTPSTHTDEEDEEED